MPRQQAITPKRHQQKHAISAGGLRLSTAAQNWYKTTDCLGIHFMVGADLDTSSSEAICSAVDCS